MEELELLVQQMIEEGKPKAEIESFIKNWDIISISKKPNGPAGMPATARPKPNQKPAAQPQISLTETDSVSSLDAGSLVSQKPIESGIGIAKEKPKQEFTPKQEDVARLKNLTRDYLSRNRYREFVPEDKDISVQTVMDDYEIAEQAKEEIFKDYSRLYPTQIQGEKTILQQLGFVQNSLDKNIGKEKADTIFQEVLADILNSEKREKEIYTVEQAEQLAESGDYDTYMQIGKKAHSAEIANGPYGDIIRINQQLDGFKKKLNTATTPEEKLEYQETINSLNESLKYRANNLDVKYFFDPITGDRLDPAKVTASSTAADDTDSVLDRIAQLTAIKDTDKNRLELAYFSHLQEYNDHQKLLNTKYNVTATGRDGKPFNILTDYDSEYTSDGTRVIKNVPLRRLIDAGLSDGANVSVYTAPGSKEVATDLESLIKTIPTKSLELARERQALGTVYLANIDPSSINKNALTTATRFVESAVDATIGADATERLFGSSTVKKLDEIEKTLSDSNVQLSDAQKENFKRSLPLQIAEGAGGFIPELVKFAAYDVATQGAYTSIGITRLLSTLKNSKSAWDKTKYLALAAGMEELKFEAVTLGGAETGAGAGFFLGGTAARKIMPFRFKGDLAAFNPALEKIVLGGAGGAAASEVASVVEAGVKQLEGDKSFMSSIKELYGDLGKAAERGIVNSFVFGLIGVHNMKPTDFKSIRSKENLVKDIDKRLYDIDKELKSLKKTKGTEYQQSKLIDEAAAKIGLKNTISAELKVAHRDIDNANISLFAEKAANAKKIISSKTATEQEKADAKNDLFVAEAAIDNASKKYENLLRDVQSSGALGEFDYELVRGKKGKKGTLEASENAKYVPGKKGQKPLLILDLLSLKKGVVPHEFTHIIFEQALNNDPVLAENFKKKIQGAINTKLSGVTFTVKDAEGPKEVSFDELINAKYGANESQTAIEYVTNIVEEIQRNPAVKRALIQNGAMNSIRKSVLDAFSTITGKEKLPLQDENIRDVDSLLNLLYKFGSKAEAGKDITKEAEELKNILIDGSKPINGKTGEEVMSTEKASEFASKELDKELGDSKKDIFSKAEKAYKEYATDPAYKDNEAVIGMMVGLEFEPIVKKIVDKRRDIPGFDLYRNEIVEAVTTETRPGFNGIPDLVALYRRGQKLIAFAKKNPGDQEAINKKAAELGVNEKRIADFVEMAKGTKEEASLTSFVYGQLPNRIQGIIERKFPELGRSFELTEGTEGRMTEAESMTVEDSFVGEGGFYDMSAPEITMRASKEKAYKVLELPDEFVDKISKPIEKFLLGKLPDLEARTVGNFTTAKGESVNVSLYDNGKATIILDGAPITIKARTQAEVATYLIKEGVIDADNFNKSKNFRESAIEYSKNAIFNNLQDYVGGTLKKGTVASEAYAEFVNKSYSLYKNYLSQSNINKRFSVFADPVIDKATGKQARAKTAVGEPIFKKREITPQEWSEYFVLGTGSKSGRIDGRRRSLLEAISEEIGSDQIVSKLFDNEFKEIFEKRQGEISDNLIDNYAAIMAKNLDRGVEPESFASKELQDVFEEINQELNLGTKEELARFIMSAPDSKDKLVIDLYDKFINAIEAELKEKVFIKNTSVVDKMNQDTKAIIKRMLGDDAPNLNKLDYKTEDIPSSRKNKTIIKAVVMPEADALAYKNLINNVAQKLGNYNLSLLSKVLGGQGKMAVEVIAEPVDNNAEPIRTFERINGKYIEKITSKKEAKNNQDVVTVNDFVHSNDPEILKIAELVQSQITKGEKFENARENIVKRQEKILNYLDSVLLSLNESLVEAKGKSQEEFDSVFKVVYNLLKGSNHFAITRDYSQILYLDTQAKGEYKNAHTEAAAELNAKILAELYNGTLDQTKLDALKGKQVSVLTEKLLEDAVDNALGRTKSGNLLLRPMLAEIYREAKANSNGQIINIADAIQKLGKTTIADQFAVAKNLFSIPKNKFLSDIVIEKLADLFTDQFKDVNKNEAIELAKSAIEALAKPEAEAESFASKELELKQKEFTLNEMIERKKGVRATEKISKARASQLGQGKGRFEVFLPPNAQDFHDMLYNFYGKGKQGEADMQFMKENLIEPFENAENKISTHREDLAVRFKLLNKKLKSEDVKLDNELVDGVEKLGFTVEQAARVYIWSKLKYEIPNISAVEQARLISAVRKNQKLRDFADGLMEMTDMGGKYPEPDNNWFADNIKSELYSHINKSVRAKYLEPWQENINAIFSKDNLNKIEATYGKNVRFNLEQAIGRMRTGRNRPLNLGKAESAMLDYINGSNAVTMFVNTRSAVLQTISSVNFINWSDNNIYAAGKTLADPKNFAQTYLELWNSDFLRQRRSGLQIDITESEIAEAIGENKNKAKALFAKLMQAGYKPTQMADSFAIAIGGTPFYINRTKKYMSEGLSEAEAKAKAFIDFRSLAEEHQQSSRQDRVSNIQTGVAGRLIFSFNNTPFQMTRIMKRAALDLVNRRGNDKENISKLVYYSTVQNLIFYALQQGLFAAAFGDEDEKTNSNRYERLADGMISGFLRGTGLPGAVLSTAYLTAKNYQFETEKGYGADYGNTINQMLSISPPLSTKTRSVYSALKSRKYYLTTNKGKKELETKQGFFENPVMRSNIKLLSTMSNAPLSRIQTKMENLGGTMDDQYGTWQRAALALGWDKYSLGLYNKPVETEEEKKISSQERSKRARESAAKRKLDEMDAMSKMTSEELAEYLKKKKSK